MISGGDLSYQAAIRRFRAADGTRFQANFDFFPFRFRVMRRYAKAKTDDPLRVIRKRGMQEI